MYLPGARFEVKLSIKLGDEIFEPGLKGTILEGIPKMVGKAYKVKFDNVEFSCCELSWRTMLILRLRSPYIEQIKLKSIGGRHENNL